MNGKVFALTSRNLIARIDALRVWQEAEELVTGERRKWAEQELKHCEAELLALMIENGQNVVQVPALTATVTTNPDGSRSVVVTEQAVV